MVAIDWWSLKRRGSLPEVVAYERWLLMRGGRVRGVVAQGGSNVFGI